MQEFIAQAAESLGVPRSGIKTATETMLDLLKEKSDDADFSALAGQVPGLADMVGASQSAAEGSGSSGMLGMATSASSKFGGGIGRAASLLSSIEKSGLSGEQSGEFISMFVSYLQKQGGADLVGKLLSSVPELKKFAG